MNEKLKKHLESAGITFVTAGGLELYVAMENAETWSDIGWEPLIMTCFFVGARAALKGLLNK